MNPLKRPVRPVDGQGGVDVPAQPQEGRVEPPVASEGHCVGPGEVPGARPTNMDVFIHCLVDWLVVLVPTVWVVVWWVT